MVAYKLFRLLKSGEITSLFINKKVILPYDEWLDSKPYPTKGFAVRAGWHCTARPDAPHLKMSLANGEQRVWKKVIMEDYEEVHRPENQGGLWYLAKRIKIIERTDCQKCGDVGIVGNPFDLCEICIHEFKLQVEFDMLYDRFSNCSNEKKT